MPDRHIIRLKGPWWGTASSTKDVSSTNEKAFKTTIPFRWHDQIPEDFVGTVGMKRKFNGSTGMSGAPEVWLTVSALAVPAELFLNGSSIGDCAPQSNVEFEVSSHLLPFNELLISLAVSGKHSTDLLGDVALEIVQ